MSPETPSHMSAWSKEFLGWVNPQVVTADLPGHLLPAVETNPHVLRIPISGTQQYFLVENRQRTGFDAKLPVAGLAIWHINDDVINSGLTNNTVNADHTNKGVDLEEADGLAQLDSKTNRGDAGDLFPGSAGKQRFDNSTNPQSSGTISICNIGNAVDPMSADVRITTGACGGGTTNCSSILSVGSGGQSGYDWFVVVVPPLLTAIALLLFARKPRARVAV